MHALHKIDFMFHVPHIIHIKLNIYGKSDHGDHYDTVCTKMCAQK